jgi:hypothetical protein
MPIAEDNHRPHHQPWLMVRAVVGEPNDQSVLRLEVVMTAALWSAGYKSVLRRCVDLRACSVIRQR